MKQKALETKFNTIGARVKFREPRWNTDANLSIDIGTDSAGEFFDIRLGENAPDLEVLDTQKNDRHLLLMAKEGQRKSKFLCGFDERHFFSCAIPETAGVSTVLAAKQALKPENIVEAEQGIKKKDLHKRRKKAKTGKIFRQGEFFFTPVPNFIPDRNDVIHQKEPMSRGRGSKPHMAEYLIRHGGETIHLCSKYPNGITTKEYEKILKGNKETKQWGWTTRVRNPKVFVKGRISHSDHKTLDLKDKWYLVSMNTENKAAASKNVAFLD